MRRIATRWVVLGVAIVALVLAGVASRFADRDPDGLTKVSQDHGVANTAQGRDGPLGGYSGATGVVGVLVVLGLAGGITYAVRRRHPRDEQS